MLKVAERWNAEILAVKSGLNPHCDFSLQTDINNALNINEDILRRLRYKLKDK
jgi:hypothetical protein